MKTRGLFFSVKRLIERSIFIHVVFILTVFFALATAGEMIDTRIHIGLQLFRAILASDLKIKTKIDGDKKLPLLLIYKDNSNKGKKYTNNLLALGKKNGIAQIKNIPLKISSISYQSFLSGQHDKVAGIFLLDQMSFDELVPISSYGIINKLIVYSPFDGDIEKNISAGLYIGARVHPVINMKVMNASNIQLKPFFLKIAKKYDP